MLDTESPVNASKETDKPMEVSELAVAQPPDKAKKKGSARSVETFYRSAYRTQLDLTGLADMKSNIMISINGLIITAIIATEGFVTFSQNHTPFIPVFMLGVCIVSMIFAILSARPRVANLNITENDMFNGKANLLYFNNFLKINEDRYADAMLNLIEDKEAVYRMMSKHLYNMGIVLTHKYKYLRLSYLVFLGGLILTAGLFIFHLRF